LFRSQCIRVCEWSGQTTIKSYLKAEQIDPFDQRHVCI
jgi:hypothetical protein